MASRKKSKMGADPLAWMQDNDTSPVKIVTSKPVERRKKPRSKKSASGLDIDLLEQTFAALAPQGEALVKRFYAELFDRYPDVKPMFDNTAVADQEKKLLAALQVVVNSLRNPEALADVLGHLGSKHHKYGARPEHYTAVAETLLDVMAEFAGELWTDDVHAAWSGALNTVATTMLAAKQTDNTGEEDKTMAASKKVVDEKLQEDLQEDMEAARMRSAINNAMTPIMMVDRDLVITYANKATTDLLKQHEATLQDVYAGFSADNLIGVNIDMFHKNPAHQRKLLDDPKNLPYQTDIAVGPLKFALNVTAQIDATGNYIGTTLEWSDVTELRAKESAITRLQGTVDGAMTAMMMVDRDLVITYANESTVNLLKKHEAALAVVYPGFSADKIVGTCIDTFHKHPEHQRKLLADPASLPYQTDIAIGDLKFALNVTAIMDAEGHYVGNALEWSDVTDLRHKEAVNADFASQMVAISRSQAVIEFNMDGTIIQANDNFLKTVGYRLDEIQGKHHRMFVESKYELSAEYARFWEKLNAGEYEAARYKRIGKGGKEVWIQGSYNPIFDIDGKPCKVVKYATDVTAEVERELEVMRLQSAIDGAQDNFMICDADLNITYCNPAVLDMMRVRQSELRQIWPSFDADKLVGRNIDAFHKNPAHQRAMLSDPSRSPARAEIKVADLEFQVNATMITGPDGEYMGNMVEWKDITEEKNAERQIQGLIDGAVAGQLDSRIETDQFEGFLLNVGEGINRLMDAVVEPVQETRRVISGLADGDLTQSMNGEFGGEFAELRDAVNATMSKLLSMVNEIGTASGTIASAANEISQGTADLSQRSEEQASSLEETASSMEELTGTVRQNADNAREANQLANSARDEATKGGEVVGKAITAMSEINQSSKKIADIIGVIDEIAFQTNLLALNAAVEAARAGEQGRGFAVVAAEVRNLAQRSASAAKEIKSLINDSVEKVTEGSKLVDQSGATLEEIVGSVKKVSDIIAEIASAGQEQASGIDQINKAVTQMDEMTQQNAALVEEAAASSEAMNDQAVALDDLIGFFKTGENTRRPAAPAQHATRSASARPASARRSASKDNGGGEWEEF